MRATIQVTRSFRQFRTPEVNTVHPRFAFSFAFAFNSCALESGDAIILVGFCHRPNVGGKLTTTTNVSVEYTKVPQ